VVEATRYSVRDIEVMAKKAAQSRLFGMDEAQAFTLMMIAESEGIHPIQALKRYHVFQGKPSLKADAMLADLFKNGWEVEWLEESWDRDKQAARFTHARKCPKGKVVAFTMQDAEAAGLAGKDTWKHYAPSMMRARVVSMGCRMLDPGIVAGIYTPEEVADFEEKPETRVFHPRSGGAIESPAPEVTEPPRTERVFEVRGIPGSEWKPEVVERPAPSDARKWIQQECDRVFDHWASICLLEGKDPGKRITIWQVGNSLVGEWHDAGLIKLEDYKTDGKQDNTKVGGIIRGAWDEDAGGVKLAVTEYLRREIDKRARYHGIELDADEPDGEPIDPEELDEGADGQ
jgi:hypothetical protein